MSRAFIDRPLLACVLSAFIVIAGLIALRALTIGASLAADYSLGEALDDVEAAIAEVVPPHARIGYLGESREFKNSSASLCTARPVAEC